MTQPLAIVRSWDPGTLPAQGDQIGRGAASLDDQLVTMAHEADAASQAWKGDTADAAMARLTALGTSGNRASTALVSLADVLAAAGADLAAMRIAVLGAVDAATSAGLTVGDDGSVTAPSLPAEPDQAAVQATANSEATAHRDAIARTLDAAADSDARWAAAVAHAVDAIAEAPAARGAGPTGISPAVQAILDGKAQLPSDPAALYALWQSLSPEDKEAIYATDHSIGNHPGIPTIDRDHFNERHLTELQAQAQTTMQSVTAEHPDWANGTNIPPEQYGRAPNPSARQRGEYEAWLGRFNAVRTSVAGYGGVRDAVGGGPTGQPPRYLMGIDSADRAIIATGNPDTARNVTTYVPGTGATLSGIGGDVARSDSMRAAARLAGDPDAAVVTWYGYSAPAALPDATSNSYSDAGAGDLDSFQDGLRVTHDGPPSHNTVLGHSYGTTLIGAAATGNNTLNADDLVLVASPGARADNASDFHLDGQSSDTVGQHVWATMAQRDPVQLFASTGALGTAPTNLGFGDQTFASDPGSPGPWYEGGWNPDVHSEYWDRNNVALRNMGFIIAGAYDQVVPR